jgi:hypothetical protein
MQTERKDGWEDCRDQIRPQSLLLLYVYGKVKGLVDWLMIAIHILTQPQLVDLLPFSVVRIALLPATMTGIVRKTCYYNWSGRVRRERPQESVIIL